jgi:apolipoprotein D and lipocalin family protein
MRESMMFLREMLLVFMTVVLFGACARPSLPPLKVVPAVDLNRYAGTWYEIARYPQRFQKDCTASKATIRCSRRDGAGQNECRRTLTGAEVRGREGLGHGPGNECKVEGAFFRPLQRRLLDHRLRTMNTPVATRPGPDPLPHAADG